MASTCSPSSRRSRRSSADRRWGRCCRCGGGRAWCVGAQIAKDLESFAKAKGVIIDLRGNPGGIGAMAMGIAGYLVSDENKKLGTMRTRPTPLDFVINPQATRYGGQGGG